MLHHPATFVAFTLNNIAFRLGESKEAGSSPIDLSGTLMPPETISASP